MNNDIELVTTYADRVLSLATARLGEEYFYQSLPLCVIDAVWSVGVRYEAVQGVVARYCKRFGLRRIRADRCSRPPMTEQESIAQFCDKAEKLGSLAMADTVFENRQRTSTRNGILKAEAVYRFASTLRSYDVNYLQEIPTAATAAHSDQLERDIRNIPGQGSGISLRYFWMLAGSDELIKPDRWILRFLEAALRRRVLTDEAQDLVIGATERLRVKFPHLTPRLLDHEVWKHQRMQPNSALERTGGSRCSPSGRSLRRWAGSMRRTTK